MSYQIKISKQGLNVLGTASTDPNNLIVDTGLNTFKILKEGTAVINHTPGTLFFYNYYSFAHNAPISSPSSFICFYKFPDGKIAMGNGTFGNTSYDGIYGLKNVTIGTTNILQQIGGSPSASIYVKYYVFETPLV